MNPWPRVPLIIQSGYSLLKSMIDVDRLAGELADRGFRQAVLADDHSWAGAEKFDDRLRRQGVSPWLGITRRIWVADGQRVVRLVAETREAWHWLIQADDVMQALPEGVWVIVAASQDSWWLTGADELGRWAGERVVVELWPGQPFPAVLSRRGWHWIPGQAIRFHDPEDRQAYHVLCQLGGETPHPLAVAVPASPETWAAAYRERDWPDLWQPDPPSSLLARDGWKLPHSGEPDEFQALTRRARQGLQSRLGHTQAPVPWQRLEYELSVIRQLGFAGYFLMVADVVDFARQAKIRVGPGRGSVAGSLVAYALGITDINPLRYHLYFERFLNPARHTLPDIDLDFDFEKRPQVIQYLRERWGSQRVAQIGTFGSLGARAVLRDVARVTGVPSEAVDRLLERVHLTPQSVLAEHRQELAEAARDLGLATDWLLIADRLEGLPRHRSTHAAGVVITPGPVRDWVPCLKDAEGQWITEWEGDSVERLGLVKLDVLGLRTLTVVDRIRHVHPEMPDWTTVPGDDGPTFMLLGRGDTDGVFQLDGRGVKELLRQMKPVSLEEIMMVVALYRPGPMEAISEFLRRRSNPELTREGDPISELCRDTYGIMIYQEQLMAVVQALAGYSLVEADLFRRAISKKDHALLAQERTGFLARLAEQGFDRGQAENIWRRIEAFKDYGFNKSHAASYGLLSYYLAYLKAHYPLAFWAAELSTVSGDRLDRALRQVISQGIRVRPPHVNASEVGFTVVGEELQAGLGMLRGVGTEVSRRIVEERNARGPFQSPTEWTKRMGRLLSPKTLEELTRQGALRGLTGEGSPSVTQLSWFDAPSPAGAKKPDPAVRWLEASGPLYVKCEEGVDRTSVAEEIYRVAREFPGPVPVVVADGRRGQRLPVTLNAHFRAIQAIKAVAGVLSAGRQVEWLANE